MAFFKNPFRPPEREKQPPIVSALTQLEYILNPEHPILRQLAGGISEDPFAQIAGLEPTPEQLRIFLGATKMAIERARDRYGDAAVPSALQFVKGPVPKDTPRLWELFNFSDFCALYPDDGTFLISAFRAAKRCVHLGKNAQSGFVYDRRFPKDTAMMPHDFTLLDTAACCHHISLLRKGKSLTQKIATNETRALIHHLGLRLYSFPKGSLINM